MTTNLLSVWKLWGTEMGFILKLMFLYFGIVDYWLSFINWACCDYCYCIGLMKGGLISLAAATVGLTNEAAQHLEVSVAYMLL